MKQYVTAEEGMRKKLLHEIIAVSYPFLFNGALDLDSATASQLREAFEENTGASGETVNRCIVFFKDAAVDSGMKISPYITQKKARNNAPRGGRPRLLLRNHLRRWPRATSAPNLHFNSNPAKPRDRSTEQPLAVGACSRGYRNRERSGRKRSAISGRRRSITCWRLSTKISSEFSLRSAQDLGVGSTIRNGG